MTFQAQYARLPVSVKLLSPLLLAFLSLWTAGTFSFGFFARNNLELTARKEIVDLASLLQESLKQRQELLTLKARSVSEEKEVIEAVIKRDRALLLRKLLPIQTGLKLDLVRVVDADGQPLLSSQLGPLIKATLQDATVNRAAATGLELSGILLAKNALPSSLVALISIKSSQKVLAGLVVAVAIDDSLLQSIRGNTSIHLVAFEGDRVTAATLPLNRDRSWQFPRSDELPTKMKIANEEYLIKTTELQSFDRTTLKIAVLQSTKEMEQAEKQLWFVVGGFGLLGCTLICVVTMEGFRVTQALSHRIQSLTKVTQQLAEGDLAIRIQVDTQDEVGILAQGFNSMAEQLTARDRQLSQQMQQLEKTLTELHYSQQLLQLVIDNIPLSIFWKDCNLTYLGCNQIFAKIAGLESPENIVGKTDYDLPWQPEEFAWLQNNDRRVINSDTAELGMIECQLQENGSVKWFETNKVTLHNYIGEVIGILGTVQDITASMEAKIVLNQMNQELEVRVKNRTTELQLVNQELSRLVNLDGLTQVANRRRFDNYLAGEWQRHLRNQQFLALIIMDIDYFKRYNDYYGHQSGDDCLIRVAQAIAKILQRPTDLVARYGGEEFVVILPNTNTEGALMVAESIRIAIATLAIPHAKSKVSQYVTLSLGVASLIPTLENSPADLIALADRALYTAKKEGRDRAFSLCDR